MAPIRVLLTNDDGPPSKDSPFILGLYLELKKQGYDVKVVIPSSQKSWIGKAYQIKDKITGRYYYPRAPGGPEAETSVDSRPLKDGELGEWILLDGTPATCANIGIHNLYPGAIDLLISGPNYGRNTSSAFVLSSGTIGAALSSSLSSVRSIALSYGVFHHPNPPEYIQPAHDLGAKIVKELWERWGKDEQGARGGEVDLYNVNIPLVKELVEGEMEVVWTRIWRNQYASLFALTEPSKPTEKDHSAAGPDAVQPSASSSTAQTPSSSRAGSPSFLPQASSSGPASQPSAPSLTFHFHPQMKALVNPPLESLPYGSDAWAVHHGKASVTPLRTSFAEPGIASMQLEGEGGVIVEETKASDGGGRVWQFKSTGGGGRL